MSVTELGSRTFTPVAKLATTPSRRGPTEVIQRQKVPYWMDRGWVRQGSVYIGNYQTVFGAFQGRAEERGNGFFRFYMTAPPTAVRRSSHWPCFQPRRTKGFFVHMRTMPADIGSGIMTIERLITEAFEQAT